MSPAEWASSSKRPTAHLEAAPGLALFCTFLLALICFDSLALASNQSGPRSQVPAIDLKDLRH